MADAISANCGFCKIVRSEVSSDSVFEDDVSLAFLDHRPVFPGHCLLIPKQHVATLADLPSRLIAPLFSNVKLMAQAVEKGLLAEGTFIAINNRVSQSVPHLHIHIVPRRKKDGLKGFFWPRQSYRDREHLVSVQRALQNAITELKDQTPGPTET